MARMTRISRSVKAVAMPCHHPSTTNSLSTLPIEFELLFLRRIPEGPLSS